MSPVPGGKSTIRTSSGPQAVFWLENVEQLGEKGGCHRTSQHCLLRRGNPPETHGFHPLEVEWTQNRARFILGLEVG